jgi:hypothetical protein
MNNIVGNEIAFQAHCNGDCEDNCMYCEMEDELNVDYGFKDERNSKIAKVGRSEKNIKRI